MASPSGQAWPSLTARADTSWRVDVPVLCSRFDTCTLTVFSLMNSALAISAYVRPATRWESTSSSRFVNEPKGAGAGA